MAHVQVVLSGCRTKYYVFTVPEDHGGDYLPLMDCEWTRMYPIVAGVDRRLVRDPRQCYLLTLEYMFRFGIENVRGDIYSALTLTPEQIKELEDIFPKPDDTCYVCGESGHLPENCEHIGKPGHGVLDTKIYRHHFLRCVLCAKAFYSIPGYEGHLVRCELRPKDLGLFQGVWSILCPIINRKNELHIKIIRPHVDGFLTKYGGLTPKQSAPAAPP